jgi:hypothetical protein
VSWFGIDKSARARWENARVAIKVVNFINDKK